MKLANAKYQTKIKESLSTPIDVSPACGAWAEAQAYASILKMADAGQKSRTSPELFLGSLRSSIYTAVRLASIEDYAAKARGFLRAANFMTQLISDEE